MDLLSALGWEAAKAAVWVTVVVAAIALFTEFELWCRNHFKRR